MKFKLIIAASALSATISTQVFAITLTCPTTISVDECVVRAPSSLPSVSAGCNVTQGYTSILTINWPDPDKDNVGGMWMGKAQFRADRAADEQSNGVVGISSTSATLVKDKPTCTYEVVLWDPNDPQKEQITLSWSIPVSGCKATDNQTFTDCSTSQK